MNVYIERRCFKIKQKCKEWLGSAAGRISLLLFIISLLMLIIACSSWDATSERAASNINNILFGISTNLLGIIVTVSFVQYFIDKQNERRGNFNKTIRQIYGSTYKKVFNVLSLCNYTNG